MKKMFDQPIHRIPFGLVTSLFRLDLVGEHEYRMSDIFEYEDFAQHKLKSPKVLFVGINPSDESPDNSAFHPATKSGKIVRGWVKNTLCTVKFTNLCALKNSDAPKLDKRKLGVTMEIEVYRMRGYKIIACGEIVSNALTRGKIKHFAMPHPSGLNRFWNDKKAGDAKIQEMLEWITASR